MGRADAAHYVTLMLLTFAFGALFFGWFSDRIGRRKPVLLFGTVVYTAVWSILYMSGKPDGFAGYLLFMMMGFAGSAFVITFACAKETINPELSGMAVSVVNTGCFVGTALMQPLFGWVADLTWDGTLQEGVRVYSYADYQNGFVLMLVFAVLGLLAS